MKRAPRILPLVVIAAGGVLAVRLVSGAASMSDIAAGAKAWAEDMNPGAHARAASQSTASNASAQPDKAAPPIPPGDVLTAAAAPPPPVCAPSPAELAKQAGLSPAELQTLQNLGARRTQLDQREQNMQTQMALLAAAETKVDAKLQQLAGLKTDIQGLLGQADAQKASEIDHLVVVFQKMKPKDAAARFTLLDDSVRLPVALKMKDAALSAILAEMTPTDAKVLTERLAGRATPADQARDAMNTANAPPPAPVAANGAAPSAAAPPAAANGKG
jgi:flagellar motility protein MotE (MotC chaperone)